MFKKVLKVVSEYKESFKLNKSKIKKFFYFYSVLFI